VSIVFEKIKEASLYVESSHATKLKNNQRIAQKSTVLSPFFNENCMTLIFEIIRT
jgi:hypothetical protein